MRRSLLESFDKIYILDLHGNSKKKETAPDGTADQNVFDIMQGVSINLFVKTKQKKKGELGKLYQYDLQGKRSFKYDFLKEKTVKNIDWNQLKNKEPNLFFANKNFEGAESYDKGFKIDEIFIKNSSGIETRKDNLVISDDIKFLENVILDFKNLNVLEIQNKYKIDNKSRDWKIEWAIEDILNNNPQIKVINCKPLINKNIIYTGKTKGINGYPMFANFKNFIDK